MNSSVIKRKDWDSNFFNLEIYELDFANIDGNELKEILIESANCDVNLIYIFSHCKEKLIEQAGAKLVDTKVLYRKSINIFNERPDPNIFSFSSIDDYKQLIDLAIESGVYSRFKLDSYFQNNEFERLYIEWIKSSVSRKIADEVFIYKSDEEILGFITVKVKNDAAEIGLIAVKEGQRGKKIGNKLLQVVEFYAGIKGCKFLNVFTQEENIPACKFYEKNEFTVVSKQNVYHYWLK